MKLKAFVATSLALACTLALAQNSNQGVSKTEITLGSIQDLSGPIAGFGKAVRNGMNLRVDELNEQGGINGRKIVLKVEDSAYDPKKAVLAAQKLVNQDKIFAMVGHIGTAQNVATFPVLFEKNVINFFPVTAAREMYEPVNRLKWSFAATYYDQMRVAAPKLAKEKGAKKVCTLYQDDEFGQEVMKGAEEGLKGAGMSLAEKTTYKRGATDFSSQIAKLKAENCDMVVLGTIIRETIGAIGTARKLGYNPIFLGSSASYTDETSQPIRFWANKYKTKFNEEPSVFSVYGYALVDTFILAAQKAGPNLNTDSFVKAMNNLTVPPDIFGSPELTFSASKHLGSNSVRMSQLEGARWKVISPYIDMK